MIHAIVYANRNGYDCFERTRDFPEEYLPRIQKICSRVSECRENQDVDTEYAMRYAPLGDRFLLSVIHRLPKGNEDHTRSHKVIVSFLLEPEDADDLWTYPVSQCLDAAETAASEILDKKQRNRVIDPTLLTQCLAESEPVSAPGRPDALGEDIQTLVLGGLLYSGADELQDQLFLQITSDPESLLDGAMKYIPAGIRKYVRFFTNVHTYNETMDVSLCCHTPSGLYNTSGGPATNKERVSLETLPRESSGRLSLPQNMLGRKLLKLYTLPMYPFFLQCVRSLDDLQNLFTASEAKEPAIYAFLSLSDPVIAEHIHPEMDLSELLNLYELNRTAGKPGNSVAEAVEKAAEEKLRSEAAQKRLPLETLKRYQILLPNNPVLRSLLNPSPKNEISAGKKLPFPENNRKPDAKPPQPKGTLLREKLTGDRKLGVRKDILALAANILVLAVAIFALIALLPAFFTVTAEPQVLTVQFVNPAGMLRLLAVGLLSFLLGFLVRNLLFRIRKVKEPAETKDFPERKSPSLPPQNPQGLKNKKHTKKIQ